ncbi:type II 3-dehydroquinate dehydratase [Streptomyces sp. NBC_00102]|uniref:type II 3-dehydroquinate dehydratase n=1 Tax=Streptomyces sp. NBC_00102 TaxID=2975652 RepID=UPI00225A4BFD|nr:type II 3-dehydroquinate dehydratase [Streptomyces sp. NBC_00102]MCX5395514.1 3-dehydroquinate dehydratase [Streptomyces sp. NBC_00102]
MPSPPRVLVLDGPNLNLLGVREPELYGSDSLADVETLCRQTTARHGPEAYFLRSSHEGALIDAVHSARSGAAGIVVDASGCTHTSIALRDALAAVERPVVEVHITHVQRREAYRRRPYVAEVADATIAGAGIHGYALALTHIAHLLEKSAR